MNSAGLMPRMWKLIPELQFNTRRFKFVFLLFLAEQRSDTADRHPPHPCIDSRLRTPQPTLTKSPEFHSHRRRARMDDTCNSSMASQPLAVADIASLNHDPLDLVEAHLIV